MASSLPAGPIRWVSRVAAPGVAALVLGLLMGAGAALAQNPSRVTVTIESVSRVTDVAGYRLAGYLQKSGCNAEVEFGPPTEESALAFRLANTWEHSDPVLVAINREGALPKPVWVTRRNAGVRSIAELSGRDLSTVAGKDPLGAALPLRALRAAGVNAGGERFYEAGDYSSALGLLLHNNTHASVSERGFVTPLLEKNNLVISWAGPPVLAGGWYRGEGWNASALGCEQVLLARTRSDDPQVFTVFPEWVHGFARPDSQSSEDVVP